MAPPTVSTAAAQRDGSSDFGGGVDHFAPRKNFGDAELLQQRVLLGLARNRRHLVAELREDRHGEDAHSAG